MIRNFDELLEEMTGLRASGWTYDRIGKAFGIHRATAWKIINQKKDPVDPDLRKTLKLGTKTEVNFINPLRNADRAIRIDAFKIDICECGQAFVSNHPRRKKCFICSPYRGKGFL